MLPTVALLCWLLIYPVGNVFYTSFRQEMLSRPKQNGFVGAANYIKIVSDPVFWEALFNSARWVVVEVGLQLVFGLGLALILKRKFRGCGVFRAILFLPWALSGVLVSMLWSMMYYENVGVLNDLLKKLGIITKAIAWTGNKNTAFWSLVVAELWRGIPFFSIMLLASLQSVPEELYDACRVDGGGAIDNFIYVSFPFIKETLVLTTLLRTIWEFNSVDLILNLTGGGPIHKTTTLAVYLANTARKDGNFGYGSALAVVSFLLLLGIAASYLKLSHFGGEEEA
jgi:multiple sugar transport system permease protein